MIKRLVVRGKILITVNSQRRDKNTILGKHLVSVSNKAVLKVDN